MDLLQCYSRGMLQRSLYKFFYFLNDFIHDTKRVFICCLVFLTFSLIFDGSIYRLWKLNKQYSFFQTELESLKVKEAKLSKDLQNVKNPAFMKRLAQERLDLADKGDLIFVFTE